MFLLDAKNKKMKKLLLKNVVYKVVFILVGIILGVCLTFLYVQKYGIPFENVLQSVSKIEETKQMQQIIDNVAKLMILPKGEQPVIATITDSATLAKEQPFYADSSNGDVVLVYQKALKAIIYNPEKNIIVNVGPVSVQPDVQNEQTSVIDQVDTTSEQKKK